MQVLKIKSVTFPRRAWERETCFKRKQEEAFTLLEVMVAISIIAIVLVSVYRLHTQTIAMAEAARFFTVAPILAQSKIAELETKSADDLTSDSGDFGDDFPAYTWSAAVDSVESELLGSVAEDLKQIDVSVILNNGESVYSFRTYQFITE
jgi:general secretion pathway protein I